jgi:hypothetical protein
MLLFSRAIKTSKVWSKSVHNLKHFAMYNKKIVVIYPNKQLNYWLQHICVTKKLILNIFPIANKNRYLVTIIDNNPEPQSLLIHNDSLIPVSVLVQVFGNNKS